MPKNIVIRKYKDKIEIRTEKGDLVVDIVVANSSKTSSVNLSLKATERTTLITKVPQTNKTQAKRFSQNNEKNPWKGFGSFLSDSNESRPKAKVARPLK